MSLLQPDSSLYYNFNVGESGVDYVNKLHSNELTTANLLLTPVDYVQSSMPTSGLFDGARWASTSNGRYYVYNATGLNWNDYSGIGMLLVGRGSLQNKLFKKNGNTWDFVINGASFVSSTLSNANIISSTLNNTSILSSTLNNPSIISGTLNNVNIISGNLTNGNITNALINTNQPITSTLNKQTTLPYWSSYHNYGGAVAMSVNESWLKGSHATSTDKLGVNYVANGVNPYLVLPTAGRYMVSANGVISNNSSTVKPTLQSTLTCNSSLLSLNYIELPLSSWNTIHLTCCSFYAPANAQIKFTLNNGSDFGSVKSYDSFFNVQCINPA
jgi:hypothetical protein